MQFKLTADVVYQVTTPWISIQPGFVYYLAIHSEVLSKISSAINSSLQLNFCRCSRSTTGSSAILNQVEVGLIMVRAIKSICELSLPLRVSGPMRSTYRQSLVEGAHIFVTVSY